MSFRLCFFVGNACKIGEDPVELYVPGVASKVGQNETADSRDSELKSNGLTKNTLYYPSKR